MRTEGHKFISLVELYNNNNKYPLFKHDRFQSSELVGSCTNQINQIKLNQMQVFEGQRRENWVTGGKTSQSREEN